MKTPIVIGLLAWAAAAAASSINATNRYTYGANVGWMDWRGNTNDGAIIGEYVCSGYIYAANLGWIHLGDGAPQNGIHYQNNSATDYGVNHDGAGNLRGFAYSGNVGWINFESNGLPRVDLQTGHLSGSIYSANCGWISLDNFPHATLRTDFLQTGIDSDNDGITDAWELSHTNTLGGFTADGDADGDGVSDSNEHLADTDPLNPSDYLRIVSYQVDLSTSEANTLRWTSTATRLYRIEYRTNLNVGATWTDAIGVIPPDLGDDTSRIVRFDSVLPERYFRVGAFKPLLP